MVPLVSVVLPVYNGAADVSRAVASILAQTYDNFELIAIDDGSKDNSYSILQSISDPRLRFFRQENMGLAATLNRGITLARGRYIARQDQDDLSHPDRLAKQVAFMEANPECALLGTSADIWVGDQPAVRSHDHPTEHGLLCFDLLFNNPFVHSSVMMRRDAVLTIGGYTADPSRQPPEDYELWSRMARQYRVANLVDRLLVYREVPQSMSRAGSNPFLDKLVMLCAENLAYANGIAPGDSTCLDVAALTHSANHRLSARPDIDRMCGLVATAGEHIACACVCPEVLSRSVDRQRILRYQYLLLRGRAHWARPAFRLLRSLGKRLRQCAECVSLGSFEK